MRNFVITVLLAFVLMAQVYSLNKASAERKFLPHDTERPFVLPASLMRIASLEFRGITSDALFLQSMIFIGGIPQRKEVPRVKDWEWQWWLKIVEAATDLDPYFFDPYFYANAFLPWDAGMAEEANELMKKGVANRSWDWMLPFFVGFNDFFFLENDEEAAEFMMEASRRPGGTPTLASLAARLAYKQNRMETAIIYLEEIEKKTDNPMLKNEYGKRIKAMRNLLVLEKGVALYKKTYGGRPLKIVDLVNRSVLKKIPSDPYGGAYYLDGEGNVRSTSAEARLNVYLSPVIKKHRNR